MSGLMAVARHAFHLDAPCPVCGAGFSQPCHTKGGSYKREIHSERANASESRTFQEALF